MEPLELFVMSASTDAGQAPNAHIVLLVVDLGIAIKTINKRETFNCSMWLIPC